MNDAAWTAMTHHAIAEPLQNARPRMSQALVASPVVRPNRQKMTVTPASPRTAIRRGPARG